MKAFRHYLTADDGVTAIEFSMLAAPFIFTLVTIVELALMFTSASMIEASTYKASREIRVGAIQQATPNPEQQEQLFRQALCAEAVVLINCDSIIVEAVNIGAFTNHELYEAQFDDNGLLLSQGFDPGGVNDVILIRSFARYRFSTPLVGYLLGSGESGAMDFMSTVVLRTEPYDFETVNGEG